MATRRLNVGDEDSVNQIDTNADGKTDVYVVTDNAPQSDLEAAPLDAPPGGPFPVGGGSTPDPDLLPNARTWRDRRITP